jgi:cell division protein FtsL
VLPNLFRVLVHHKSGFLALFLTAMMFVLFVVIVQVQHHIRHIQTQYADALNHQILLREEWGKLALEKHHLTSLARIESIAKNDLGMQLKSSRNLQHIYIEALPKPFEHNGYQNQPQPTTTPANDS